MKHQSRKTCIAIFAGLLSGLTLAAGATSAEAATVLVDFGRATNTTTGGLVTYNNVNMAVAEIENATSSTALVDTSGAATGWSINVTEDGSGFGGGAGSGADEDTFPATLSAFATTALQDSIFANGSSPGMTVTISGLDDSRTYDLLFYGSRHNLQNSPEQTWSLTQGTGGANVVHASLDNHTTVVDWDNLSTNGSGVIAFRIFGASGGGALALNFGQIAENIPAPAALPAGLAMLALAATRRRR